MRAFPHPAFIRNNQEQQFLCWHHGDPKTGPSMSGRTQSSSGQCPGPWRGGWGVMQGWDLEQRSENSDQGKGRRSERNEGFIFPNKLMDKTSTER